MHVVLGFSLQSNMASHVVLLLEDLNSKPVISYKVLANQQVSRVYECQCTISSLQSVEVIHATL